MDQLEFTKKRKNESSDSKMSKKEKKEVIKAKKIKTKPHFSVIEETKKHWEAFFKENQKIKQSDKTIKLKNKKKTTVETETDTKKRYDLLSPIIKLSKGKLEGLSRHHDASRIFQTILKYGSKEQISEIYEELKGKMILLSKDIYAHNLVKKLLLYGKHIRADIVKEFKSHYPDLISEKYPSDIVEYIYNDLSNASQRLEIIREFYGSDTLLSTVPRSLETILKENPGKKTKIMEKVADAVKRSIEKNLTHLSIVQKLIVDTFEFGSKGEILDLVMDLQDLIPHILHTKEGSKASQFCISYSSPQIRKKIIKSLKGLVVKAAQDEYGYMVICKILAVTDDTKLTDSIILHELKEDLSGTLSHEFASKIILNLFAPSDIYKNATNTTECKKGYEKINEELVARILPNLTKLINQQTDEIASNKHSAAILVEVFAKTNEACVIDLITKIDLLQYQEFSRHLSLLILKSEDLGKKIYDKITDISDFVLKNNGSFIASAIAKKNPKEREIMKKLLSKKIDTKKDIGSQLLLKVLVNPK